jgi:hypothetical protein
MIHHKPSILYSHTYVGLWVYMLSTYLNNDSVSVTTSDAALPQVAWQGSTEWIFWFHKWQGISGQADQLLVPQEQFYSTK